MITSRFPLGDVSFTAGYFSTLVGEATKHCYGVAAMAPRDMTDAVRSLVHGSDYSEKGVRVTQENGRLVIELHIAVSYGLNISTAARSISHRVKDEVEQATGLEGRPRGGLGGRCDRLMSVCIPGCRNFSGLIRSLKQ